MKVKTPELNRLQAVTDKSQAIGQFLEWLRDEKHLSLGSPHEHDDGCENEQWPNKGRKFLCGFSTGDLMPNFPNIEKLLAEYFEIDLDKCERERRRLLAMIQENN